MRLINWSVLLGSLALAACNKDKDADTGGQDSDTADSGDTGVDTADSDTSDSDTGECTVAVTGTVPTADAIDVYYRDTFRVSFDGDGSAAAISLLDSAGTDVTTEITWSEGNVQAYVKGDLAALSAYTLHVEECGVTTDIPFLTSDLGTPLTAGNASLLDHTYMIQLSESDITTPALLDAIASEYLTVPLLFNITAVDETSIDLLGALGYHENDGSYTQLTSYPTWDFPAGDFSDSPYFSAQADYVTIMYVDIPIPIEEFYLEGVFTADGNYIQNGKAKGKADSRFMGPLINQPEDAYSAFCDLGASLGIACEPCADGENYCVYIEAENITGYYQPGLTLVEVLPA